MVFRYTKLIIFSVLLLLSSVIYAAELINDKDIVSAVIDGDINEFKEIIDYIKINRPVTVPSLLKDEYLDDEDEEMRERIITALREYPLHEQSAIWIEILKSEKNRKIEIELIELLSSSIVPMFTIAIAEKLLVPRSEVR